VSDLKSFDRDYAFGRFVYPDLPADVATTVVALRRHLAHWTGVDPQIVIVCRCFNEEEVRLIQSKLAEQEQEKVRFSWLVFDPRK
jgi:hypothetical protein